VSSFRRQPAILTLLEVQGSASVIELATRFGVAGETIRRDLQALLKTGRIEKVHGGVRLREEIAEADYVQRLNENKAAKNAIGEAASALIEDGASVLIDSGTSSYYAARHLDRHSRLSIITNSLEVARETARSGRNRVYFIGGEVNNEYLSTFGVDTMAQVARYAPTVALLSIGALDPARGALDFHLDEANFKQAAAPLAKRVILLADSTKFDREALVHTLDFSQIHVLVTNKPVPAHFEDALSKVQVLIAQHTE